MSDYDNFITPNFNRVKHGNGPFTTVDDKPVPHPSTQVQDSHNNISPISLTAIGIGMLSIVTMLVVRLRRGLQPATALGDNLMEMKSQDSNVKMNSDKVGWGQLSSQSAQPLTRCYASKQEMAALAEANPDFLGKSIGLWDPLNCLDFDFWSLGNEATIGYLRHAEIKHGRVAMAGFLGYIAQSTDLVSGPHTVLPFRGYDAGLTPPEQWDAIPLYGKLQILVFVGMLESYGEGAGDPEGYVHYTKGGLPGYVHYTKGVRPEFVFNLYDPFDWFKEDKDKVRGRQVEINNGRLAMLGIFSLIAESKAPGAVPPLNGLIPEYSGNYMAPFSGDFSLFFVSPQKPESAQPQTLCSASRQEMEALAEANPDFLGQSIGFWDPLGCLDLDFWNIGNEATIGYLRHAEIKHGRVAMAGFLGYLAQSTPLVNGPHKVLPFKGYQEGLTPPEQWDAIPLYGKLQIFVFVGMLESYGEGAGQPEGY